MALINSTLMSNPALPVMDMGQAKTGEDGVFQAQLATLLSGEPAVTPLPATSITPALSEWLRGLSLAGPATLPSPAATGEQAPGTVVNPAPADPMPRPSDSAADDPAALALAAMPFLSLVNVPKAAVVADLSGGINPLLAQAIDAVSSGGANPIAGPNLPPAAGATLSGLPLFVNSNLGASLIDTATQSAVPGSEPPNAVAALPVAELEVIAQLNAQIPVARPQTEADRRVEAGLPSLDGASRTVAPVAPELKARRLSAVAEAAERPARESGDTVQAASLTAAVTTSGITESAAQSADAAPLSLASQVAGAVLRAVAHRPAEVSIVLDPPSLGSLQVKVIAHRSGLEVQLGAASEAVRAVLETQLPALRSALAEHGMSQTSFQVFVGDQPPQFAHGRAGAQGGSPHGAPPRGDGLRGMPPPDAHIVTALYRADGAVDYRA
ncbi:MAG: flagellar hook-length control protein FliK [Chloroflexi bacterium]|nr:flagellar hook-length control protein FliK [Chloroflexota bacterium]